MLFNDELLAQACLNAIIGIGIKNFNHLIETFGSAVNALNVNNEAWSNAKINPKIIVNRNQAKEYLKRLEKWLNLDNHFILNQENDLYPQLLKEIPDAPPILYVVGNLDVLQKPQIAVVGSRKASQAGLNIAFELSSNLCYAGFAITSGLAFGIDKSAHLGALQSGETIAVVGTGLDICYPQQHLNLAKDIIKQNGAIVSELPLGFGVRAENFPRRNRIITGLSLGVLVVEAQIKSGSLVSARYAMEQGREVFACPGAISNPYAKGCNKLIKEGAVLVEEASDIISELASVYKNIVINSEKQVIANIDNHEPNNQILQELSGQALNADDLANILELEIEELLMQLTDLEIDGKIINVAGRYQIA